MEIRQWYEEVRRNFWLAGLLLFSWLPTAYGQDDADISQLTPHVAIIERAPPDVEPLGPDLRLQLTLPEYSWLPPSSRTSFIDSVTLKRLPPGSLIIRYGGFEGLIAKKIHSRLRRSWRDSLEQSWNAGLLNDEGYRGALQNMAEDLVDARCGGRWWDRTWRESMPPEKGGAPAVPYVHTIGSRISVARAGPFSITNDLRIRLRPFGLFKVDPDGKRVVRPRFDSRQRLARDAALITRVDSQDVPNVVLAPSAAQRIQIDVDIPPERQPDWFRVRIRPSFAIRPLAKLSDALREVNLTIDAEFFRRDRPSARFSTIRVTAALRYDVQDNEASFVAGISM